MLIDRKTRAQSERESDAIHVFDLISQIPSERMGK